MTKQSTFRCYCCYLEQKFDPTQGIVVIFPLYFYSIEYHKQLEMMWVSSIKPVNKGHSLGDNKTVPLSDVIFVTVNQSLTPKKGIVFIFFPSVFDLLNIISN
jgi:hypothetical protein